MYPNPDLVDGAPDARISIAKNAKASIAFFSNAQQADYQTEIRPLVSPPFIFFHIFPLLL